MTRPKKAKRTIIAEKRCQFLKKKPRRENPLRAAKALLDSPAQLQYTKVCAHSGQSPGAPLTEGNYASRHCRLASLLATIVSVDPVYVHADIDEDAYLKFE